MARGGWHGYRQLSSYATMKQQLLARDTFLSAAFRMLPLFPALGESFDHMRVCIIHQMASEDESALIEEVLLHHVTGSCRLAQTPRSVWSRFAQTPCVCRCGTFYRRLAAVLHHELFASQD